MKWFKKEKIHPDRSVTRFAFLPVELSNGTTIWLEFYKKCQTWKKIRHFDFMTGLYCSNYKYVTYHTYQ